MANIRGHLLALFTICFTTYGSPAGVGERRAVIEAAERYVGVRETGENKGMPYTLFMKPYGFGPGTQWCGLFVATVYRDADVRHGVKYPALAANWSIPSTMIVYKWGKPVPGRFPMAGDLALYRFGGGRINHIEIVVNWPEDENYFWVIGGNTSNPSNKMQEGVYAKRRLKREAMIVNRIDSFYPIQEDS